MSNNLAKLSQEKKDKLNVDLAAAGVAFKERYKIPVEVDIIERKQPESLRSWFRHRLKYYRKVSINLPRLFWKLGK